MVKDDLTTAMQHIADHAHDAPTPHAGDVGREPWAGPHHRVVRQRLELRHALWRFTALLLAFGHPQAWLIAFARCFDPTAALILDIDLGQQDGARVMPPVHRWPGQSSHLRRRQGRDQHPHAPWAVFLPTAPRNPAHGAALRGGGHRHPAHLPLRDTRSIHPCRHPRRPGLRPCACLGLAMDVLVVLQPPVDLRPAPAPRLQAPHRLAAFGRIAGARPFCGLHQRAQGARQWRRAPKEASADDCGIPGGPYAPPRPSSTLARLGNVALQTPP
jgi:hypothetical protein